MGVSSEPSHDTQPFFTKSPWDEEALLRKLQQWMLHRVERNAKRENQPILFRSMIRFAKNEAFVTGNERHSRM